MIRTPHSKAAKPFRPQKTPRSPKPVKPAKPAKPKKIPSLMRKAYTRRRLQRKILKKIYIPEDRAFIEGLFVSQPPPSGSRKQERWLLPAEIKDELASDQARMKKIRLIAKEIGRQKSRIKWVPLLFCLLGVGSLVFVLSFFKNAFLTQQIQHFFENQFEARCDIGSLNLQLFNASFEVTDFAVADKTKPMRNLFSFASLRLRFNLAQLLRGRFIANEVTMEGIAVGSQRKVSGLLPQAKMRRLQAKKAAALQKQEKKRQKQLASGKSTPTPLEALLAVGLPAGGGLPGAAASGSGPADGAAKAAAVAANAAVVGATIAGVPKAAIDLFTQPQRFLSDHAAQLQLPAEAKRVQSEVNALVEKWQAVPGRIRQQVTEVKTATDAVMNFDYQAIQSNPFQIKAMLRNFADAVQKVDAVKADVERMTADFETDRQTVDSLSRSLTAAMEHDRRWSGEQWRQLSQYRLPTGEAFAASAFHFYASRLLGKAYPTLSKLLDELLLLKEKQTPDKKPKKRPKKHAVQRAPGRNLFFGNRPMPRFWIKKIGGSGTDVEVFATHIANNMDQSGFPCTVRFALNHGGLHHSGNVTVDVRTQSRSLHPMVLLHYACRGLPIQTGETVVGLPQIQSVADLQATAEFYENLEVTLKGKGQFSQLKMTTPFFEPEALHRIYSGVLSRFDTAQVGFELAAKNSAEASSFRVQSDLDTKIRNALQAEFTQRIHQVKQSLTAEVESALGGYSEEARKRIGAFQSIVQAITHSRQSLTDLSTSVQSRQRLFLGKIGSGGEGGDPRLPQTLQEKAAESQRQVERKIEDAAKNALKNLFQ